MAGSFAGCVTAIRGTFMVDVVTAAVNELKDNEWWPTVHAALDEMSDIDAYQSEAARLDQTVGDGITGHADDR